jgi:hypothetical protein
MSMLAMQEGYLHCAFKRTAEDVCDSNVFESFAEDTRLLDSIFIENGVYVRVFMDRVPSVPWTIPFLCCQLLGGITFSSVSP